MTDRAPERIWLEPVFQQKVSLDPMSFMNAIEYVRADLAPSPPALSGEAEEVVKALRAAYDEWQTDDYPIGSGELFDKAASLIERQGREIAEFMKEGTKRMFSMAARNTELEGELAEARAALKTLDDVCSYYMGREEMSSKNETGLLDFLVSRFLAWPLPQSVCSDLCATDNKYAFPRYGTNLLNADEAKQMLAYLLEGVTPLVEARAKEEANHFFAKECTGEKADFCDGARYAMNALASRNPADGERR